MQTFVFLHVGQMTGPAAVLARSLKAHHPDALIIHATDQASAPIPGTTTFRKERDFSEIVGVRMEIFHEVSQHHPQALYLDADMMCLKPLDIATLLGSNDAAVCVREFDRDTPFPASGESHLAQYCGRPLGSVHPVIACATAVRNPLFWRACLDRLNTYPRPFRTWWGDQEALRDLRAEKTFAIGTLPESRYACLPEYESGQDPTLLHFKGRRIAGMRDRAIREGFANA